MKGLEYIVSNEHLFQAILKGWKVTGGVKYTTKVKHPDVGYVLVDLEFTVTHEFLAREMLRRLAKITTFGLKVLGPYVTLDGHEFIPNSSDICDLAICLYGAHIQDDQVQIERKRITDKQNTSVTFETNTHHNTRTITLHLRDRNMP